jgi:AGCS family alanine or glycine:cation symporter
MFAFSTVPAWYYYGLKCVEYLFPSPGASTVYRRLFLLITALSPLIGNAFIWEFSDTLNGLMAIPNLIALLLLRKKITAPHG